MTVSTGDDQFDAMVATLPELPEEAVALRKTGKSQLAFEVALAAMRPGADDLYCGHLDEHGLAWTRMHCPICSPKCPVCGGTGRAP